MSLTVTGRLAIGHLPHRWRCPTQRLNQPHRHYEPRPPTSTVRGGASLGSLLNNLVGADFTNASLQYRDFAGAVLHSSNFSAVRLTGSDVHGANFSGSTFSGAFINKMNAANANFSGSIFSSQTRAQDTSFQGANFSSIALSSTFTGGSL